MGIYEDKLVGMKWMCTNYGARGPYIRNPLFKRLICVYSKGVPCASSSEDLCGEIENYSSW
jgi:hypothetical protein